MFANGSPHRRLPAMSTTTPAPESSRCPPSMRWRWRDEDSPVFLGAFGNVVAAAFLDEPKITEAFKTGKGVGWNRRSECLFCGTARFFRTGYQHNLVQA